MCCGCGRTLSFNRTGERVFQAPLDGGLECEASPIQHSGWPARASIGLAASASSSPTQSAATGPVDYYVDALLRSKPAASPNTADSAAVRREIAGILMNGLRDGEVSAPDRKYVADVVAARTGLSQVDADKRVTDVNNQAKTALDNARKSAAKLSLWLTASLLIGAFAASLAATEGGFVRDNWNPDLRGR